MKPNLPENFQKAIDEGLVSCRKHPVEDLWILNYTPECQFSRAWNEVTLQCRGLIVDAEGKDIARPFKKFFNISEHDNPDFEQIPYGTSFKAYEKMDGSMGISYWSSGGWEIATRGSFESDQAHFATTLLSHKYSEAMSKMNPAWSYIFEIIYKENRIVVDYGNTQELVLLGVIDTKSGHEYPLEIMAQATGFRIPQCFDVSDIESLPRDTQNFEGYVVRFDNGLRVKVKLDDYVRLHKLMTGITPNRIWEMLAAGQDVESVVKELPDEMYDEVMDEVERQREHYSSLLNLHVVLLDSLEIGAKTRKEQAIAILELCKRSQSEVVVDLIGLVIPLNSAVFFLLLDGQKEIAKQKTWNLVKPVNGNKLICKVEAEG